MHYLRQGIAEFLNARAGVDQAGVIRRIGNTEIRRQAERFALHHGDALIFQKSSDEIAIGLDDFTAFGF